MDRISPEQRSALMSRTRGKDTAPELQVRRMLHALGYRFRLHRRDLPGCPDIFLPRLKTAVFVHGCFWHGHEGCKRATIPKTRTEFWRKKILSNKTRDDLVKASLRKIRIRRIIIWEAMFSTAPLHTEKPLD
jgi:DNA mismatch endonuclease (patch repair protein)